MQTEYRSEQHKHIVESAIDDDGQLTLVATKKALESHGVAWPHQFNTNTSRAAVELDSDMCEIMFRPRK